MKQDTVKLYRLTKKNGVGIYRGGYKGPMARELSRLGRVHEPTPPSVHAYFGDDATRHAFNGKATLDLLTNTRRNFSLPVMASLST